MIKENGKYLGYYEVDFIRLYGAINFKNGYCPKQFLEKINWE